jgi:hypothetical protein
MGDPGAGGPSPRAPRSYLFDAYQGAANATSTMYEVTTPTGRHYDFVHPLTPGEAFNNSFAAITPDGQWMVSGEWGTMSRLLVFPTPLLNPAAPAGGTRTLPLAGEIHLDRPVSDIQGCDFQTARILLCSSDGTKQILGVDLEEVLAGRAGQLAPRSVSASVMPIAAIPLRSPCPATITSPFEVEGVDYDSRRARLEVEVIPPAACSIETTIYDFRP